MQTFATVVQYVLLVVAVITIVLVLVQKTKSAGIGAAYGSDTESFSARGKSAKREATLQKLTIIAGIVFGVLALALVVLY